MAIFDEKIEIRERCKGVHCVDLGESAPTRIYLQKSASIQPRTSPSKFGGNYSILFNRVLTADSHEGEAERRRDLQGQSTCFPLRSKRNAKHGRLNMFGFEESIDEGAPS